MKNTIYNVQVDIKKTAELLEKNDISSRAVLRAFAKRIILDRMEFVNGKLNTDSRGRRSISGRKWSKIMEQIDPGAVYYIAPTGDDKNDGLTCATAVRTIGRVSQLQALDDDNDVIKIAPGSYVISDEAGWDDSWNDEA